MRGTFTSRLRLSLCLWSVLAIPVFLVGCAGAVKGSSQGNPAVGNPASLISIPTNPTLPTGQVGSAYTASVGAAGGAAPYIWGLDTGSWPQGIALNAAGGISGTPSQAGSFSVTLGVHDSSTPPQTATRVFTLTVSASPLEISSTSLPSGTVSAPYSSTLVAANGVPPYSWSVANGQLPPGLTLQTGGQISGTPSQAGSFSVTLGVHDSSTPLQTATQAFTLTISASPIQITTTSLPSGTVSVAYSGTLAAANGVPPYSWSVTSGQMPPGLTLQTGGQISGTPSQAGISSFSVQAKDTSGKTATASLSMNIAAPPVPVVSGVSPSAGPISGGTTVTISGAKFASGASVTFGGTAATSVTVSSSSQIQAVTPGHVAGSVGVLVQVNGVSSSSSINFTYIALTPTVSSISPSNGGTAGGTAVTINGTNFLPGALVLFGSASATGVTVKSPTQIRAITPANSAGTVNVTIEDPGNVNGVLSSGFTYTAPASGTPTITIALPEASVSTGSELTGTVTLGEASAGSVTVTLSSSSPNSVAETPSVLTVAAGETTASFNYYGIAEGESTLSASAEGFSPASTQVIVTSSAIPSSLLGLTVLDFTALSPSMPFGTTRSWDAYPNLDWSDANPSRGTYDFSYLDKFIAINQARGADIIYTIGRTPRWASSQPNAPSSYGPGECAPPANMSDYENFITAIATHVAGQIKYWELWNEPQGAGMYCGDMSAMVTMAQDAARIIKGIDPDALILSPGVTGGPGPAWVTSFLSQGGAAYVDVIAFHGYWSAKAEDLVNVISSYRSVMAENGVAGKPLWDTEASWAGFGKLGTPSSSAQVGFIAKYYLLHWSMGVPRFVWYAYDGGPIWGGLWNSTTGESPAATSYHETYRWMVGATLTSPCSANQVSGIWSCTFTRPDGYLSEAVWISNSTATYTVPTQYTEYLDLAGAVQTITGPTITVGDQPILLESGTLP
jgi:hypothetical protein